MPIILSCTTTLGIRKTILAMNAFYLLRFVRKCDYFKFIPHFGGDDISLSYWQGICWQLHSNLQAKLARLTSYHESKPLKLLKLSLENVDYKNLHFFFFFIKITTLDFTKIRQHNGCMVVKLEIQKSPVYIKIHSQYFPKNPTTTIKDFWSSSKYKIRINPT